MILGTKSRYFNNLEWFDWGPPDRYWHGVPLHLIEDVDAFAQTGLSFVPLRYDVWQLGWWVTPSKVGAWFYCKRHRYYPVTLRWLLRRGLIERPHESQRFSWRAHFRPLRFILGRHW